MSEPPAVLTARVLVQFEPGLAASKRAELCCEVGLVSCCILERRLQIEDLPTEGRYLLLTGAREQRDNDGANADDGDTERLKRDDACVAGRERPVIGEHDDEVEHPEARDGRAPIHQPGRGVL